MAGAAVARGMLLRGPGARQHSLSTSEGEAEPELQDDSDEDQDAAEPELLVDSSDDELSGGVPEPELQDDSDDCDDGSGGCGVVQSSETSLSLEKSLADDRPALRTVCQTDSNSSGSARRAKSYNDLGPTDKAARREWWRQKARDDVAQRLQDVMPPTPTRSPGVRPDSPLLAPAEVSRTSADFSEEGDGDFEEDEQSERVEWDEEVGEEASDIDSPSEAARQLEIEEVRSEFSAVQEMIQRLRAPAPTSSMMSSPSRSVNDIAKDIAAGAGLPLLLAAVVGRCCWPPGALC